MARVFPQDFWGFPQQLARMPSHRRPSGECRDPFIFGLTGFVDPFGGRAVFVDAPHQCPRILVVSPCLGLSLLVVERFDASPLAVPYWLHQRSDDTARWVRNNSN